MANIQQVVTGRHDWREQKLFKPDHPKADDRGHVKGLLCRNCRRAHYPDVQGDPELRGCLSDIQVQHVGKSRQGDYLEQEMRIRSEQERVDPRDQPQVDSGQRISREDFDRLREHVERTMG